MQISRILAKIEIGDIALPSFQRGYVWKRRQVRAFFDSLYRKHPVGSLLTWVTKLEDGGYTELLLDGQQRVTSVYGVIKGQAPAFFSGDDRAFTNLRFHALAKKFEFHQPIKMRNDPFWFDVTEVMQKDLDGVQNLVTQQIGEPQGHSAFKRFYKAKDGLLQLLNVKNRELHIEQVTEEKSIGTVVDIFNRLNSAGTNLSTGDLALARIASRWPGVREEMRGHVERWATKGFEFKLDWLLRCVNAVVNGEAAFQHLHDLAEDKAREGLHRTVKHVDAVLNQLSQRLGLDHDRVLFGRFSIPVLVRHLELHRPGIMAIDEWNRLLYWFLQAGIRGRFSGTTETKIRQDLVPVDGTADGIGRLIADIGTKWGRRRVTASDFEAWSRGARLYPALYWLTRVGGARNFCDGTELKAGLLGAGAQLEVHHIFPKKVLYQAGYTKPQVNALGNFCFLTAACNNWIGAARPAEPSTSVKGRHDPDLRRIGREGYFAFVEQRNPGVLNSQWIPMDEELWKVDNYLAFLEARRSLLAGAANAHLASLYPAHAEARDEARGRREAVAPSAWEPRVSEVDEDEKLDKLRDWLFESGLDRGELGLGDIAGQVQVDLAWPGGLPEGRGRPVALLLDQSAETYRTVSQAGFDCHTDIEEFKRYVTTEIIGEDHSGAAN